MLLARKRGMVMLEAVFSITLLLGFTIMLWGAAVVVYNQSVIQGAAEAAAQQALVTYDRESYRVGPSPAAVADAQQVAQSVMAEDTIDLLGDSKANQKPSVTLTNFQIVCAADYTSTFSAGNCGDPVNGRVERVDTSVSANGQFWMLAPINNQSWGSATYTFSANGSSYSSGPVIP